MGRKERTLDHADGPLAEFAVSLRRLRRSAGSPSYRTLAERTHFSVATLSRAAAGNTLPSAEVTQAFVVACGGDAAAWLAERERVKSLIDLDSGGVSNASLRNEAQTASDGQVRYQLPADSRIFVGREPELDRLRALADESVRADDIGATVVISAIDGMAGVGKSTLAVHAAQAVRRDFPDGQYFLNLHGHTPGMNPLTPEQALDALLRSFGLESHAIPQGLDERAALYRGRLHGTRSLIVLDNARSTAQVRPLMPGSAGCMVLITSRRRLTGLEDAHAIALDLLSEQDAATLLHRIAGAGRIPDAHPAIPELIALCGYLPLAIRITAARLRHHRFLPIEEVVEQLRGGPGGRLARLVDDERGLEAVFESSYTALGPDEQRMFRYLGLTEGPDVCTYAAALADTDLPTASRLLESLLDHNLLTQHAAGRYRFHDLVRLYAAERAATDAATDRTAAARRLAAWYVYACSEAIAMLDVGQPRAPEESTVLRTPAIEFTDSSTALAWLDYERANLPAASSMCDHYRLRDIAAQLSATIYAYHNLRGLWADFESMAEIGLRNARADGNALGEALALNGLGWVHMHRGQTDQALESMSQALAIYERIGNLSGEARTLDLMGVVAGVAGKVEAGIGFQRRCLEKQRQLDDPISMNSLLASMAQNYVRLGQYETFFELYDEVLPKARADGSGFIVAPLLETAGEVHLLLGQIPEAIEVLVESVAILSSIGDQPSLADAREYLGNAYCAAGDMDQALASWASATEIFEQCDPPRATKIRERSRDSGSTTRPEA